MFPDLSYILHALFNTEVDNAAAIVKTFGLMLGVAFLACAYFLRSEFIRLEAKGLIHAIHIDNPNKNRIAPSDLIINGLVTAFLVSKIPFIYANFEAFKANPAAIVFSIKGNWLIGVIAAIAYAAFLYYKDQKRDLTKETEKITVHPHEKTMDVILVAALSGVLGSKLFSIFENMDDFLKDPVGQFFSGSGLTMYGGLILAFIAVYWYVKKIGVRPIYMMDIAAMGILLGYGIGRIGCHLSGDGDWGIVASAQPSWWFLPDWLWAYHYPNNVSNDGIAIAGCDADLITNAKGDIEERCKTICNMRYCHQLDPKVYPTAVYETIISLLGFALLYILRNKIKITGMLFFIYMVYNGMERFFIETIRVNEKYEFLGFNYSQAQYISILFIIIGIAGCGYLYTKKEGWEREL